MCTRDKEFTIRGTGDCLARGFDRTGFFEVDTGEQQTWTVQLTETGETAQRPAAAGPPQLTGPAPAHAIPATRPGARKPGAMRRQRRTKIVATLGPASSDRPSLAALFAAGADVFRINMSHTTPDRMRELVAHDPRSSSTNMGGRSAPWSTCKDRNCASAPLPAMRSMLAAGANFVLDSDPAPGNAKRVNLPHPEILSALRARPYAAARRRQDQAAWRSRPSPRTRRRPRRGRRQAVVAQGRQPARHGAGIFGADRARTIPISKPRSMPASTGSALSFVQRPGRRRRGQEDRPRPRRGDGQDRKAAGRRAAGGYSRSRRCADGGARRSRRRNAAREGPGACRSR